MPEIFLRVLLYGGNLDNQDELLISNKPVKTRGDPLTLNERLKLKKLKNLNKNSLNKYMKMEKGI